MHHPTSAQPPLAAHPSPSPHAPHAPPAARTTDPRELEYRVRTLERAIFSLIWRRTGFGEHCIHCGHQSPDHEHRCKAAEVEEMVRA